ncbi:MAG: glycosyltransferase [Desulfobacterales bacterium]|nr:glycosyltransferase [Desulfobacterales bacterium]
MLVNLARGLDAVDIPVDFLCRRAKGQPYLGSLPSKVRIVELENSRPNKVIKPLVHYLNNRRPAVLMTVKRHGREPLLARQLAKAPTRVIIRTGTTESERAKWRNALTRWKTFHNMRKYYPEADSIIAVSHGVASDINTITGIPIEKIPVIANPVITPELPTLARGPVDHPWFNQDIPIILGMGGFRRQKDFPTLIRAFATAQKQRRMRLVILGEGRQRSRLEKLSQELGIEQDFHLPGFMENPYPYMSRANLFALSSLWEGSPNALTEALAIGTPVVSTDCRSGPGEVLQNGRYGILVPPGDPEALAQAILSTLEKPLDAATLRSAVSSYTIESSAREYLKILRPEQS